MARGGRALRRHRKRSDAFDGRLDAPPEVSVTRSAQRRPRAPHRRCDSGESARSAAEALGATAVDAVNGPSRSGPRAAPSGDSRGHAGVSMASIALNFSRAVRAGARPLRAPALHRAQQRVPPARPLDAAARAPRGGRSARARSLLTSTARAPRSGVCDRALRNCTGGSGLRARAARASEVAGRAQRGRSVCQCCCTPLLTIASGFRLWLAQGGRVERRVLLCSRRFPLVRSGRVLEPCASRAVGCCRSADDERARCSCC